MFGRSSEAAVLAFDTSGAVGSVAVQAQGRILAHGVITRRAEHAAGLLPLIDEVLSDAGVDLFALGAIVVGQGPGSFTGVRVAAATAKGLGRSLGVPLWAVSSLAAAALAADVGSIRYALFDARAERVYGACYSVEDNAVETLVPPHAGDLRGVLVGDVPRGATFVGDGSEKHRIAIEGAGFPVEATDPDVPLAIGLLEFVRRAPDLLRVQDVSTWEPEYVRVSGAERLWGP